MAITDHKKEVLLVISNNIKDVWVKTGHSLWVLSKVCDIKWDKESIYISDNKHAEVRKEWHDTGKPQLEISLDGGNSWQEKGEYDIDWGCESIEVRVSDNEWETPEGEDPLRYHAKRLSGGWVEDWGDSNQVKWYIYQTETDCISSHPSYSTTSKVLGTIYMSKDAAYKIASALNDKDLVL